MRETHHSELNRNLSESHSEKLKDKRQQRGREIVAHSSCLANNRVSDAEADKGDGKEERAKQSEEDGVQQRDHSNTDLFTD